MGDDESNRRLVLRFTEEDLPEDPKELMNESVKAVSFLPLLSDELFVQLLGMLSQYAAGVSVWGEKLVIPKSEKNKALIEQYKRKPPKGQLN